MFLFIFLIIKGTVEKYTTFWNWYLKKYNRSCCKLKFAMFSVGIRKETKYSTGSFWTVTEHGQNKKDRSTGNIFDEISRLRVPFIQTIMCDMLAQQNWFVMALISRHPYRHAHVPILTSALVEEKQLTKQLTEPVSAGSSACPCGVITAY